MHLSNTKLDKSQKVGFNFDMLNTALFIFIFWINRSKGLVIQLSLVPISIQLEAPQSAELSDFN